MLSLVPTREQQEITDALRGMLAAEWPLDRFRQPAEHGDAQRWQTLPDMGVLGLGLGASHGGLGLSAIEEMLVFREFGRFLLPPRVLATVLGAHVAALSGCAELCADLLSGKATVAILNAIGGNTAPGPRLTGRYLVVDGNTCDTLLVWGRAGAALVSRQVAQPHSPRASLDETVNLESCELHGASTLAWLSATDEPLYLRADVLLSAMLVGISEAARDMAAGYAKLREAFGQPIGAFQAIKHLCADAAVRAEAAWCQTCVAALGLRDLNRPDGRTEKNGVARQEALADVAAARWIATQAAQANAESNIQVHGGMGFSAEADPHRYVKRAIVLAQLGALGRMLSADLLAPCTQAATTPTS